MTNHETNETTTPIEPGSDSSFGMIVGGILLAIGAYQYFKGFSAYYWIAGPGAVLILLGMLVPPCPSPTEHRLDTSRYTTGKNCYTASHVSGFCRLNHSHRSHIARHRERFAETQAFE